MAYATTDPTWRGSIARFWRRSHAGDHLGLALLIAIYVVVRRTGFCSVYMRLPTEQMQLFVEPFHRMFSLDDRSKSFPHALVQRVSSNQNILYAGVAPLAILTIWALAVRPGLHKAHVTILGLFISLFLTSVLTDIVKNAVGRPRPDLLARCKPELETPQHELVTVDVCTETDHHTLHDGWRSFPSGHSSFAFAGLGYLSLFVAGQWHIFQPGTDLTRTLIFLSPLIGAALIAISRLEDYRHDVYDVTAGSLLGMLIAYFSYRRYYRHLKHLKCHELYTFEEDRNNRKIDPETGHVRTEDFELDGLDEEEEEGEEARPLNSR